MYIIFGCGATGNAVVDALNKAGKDILIIDKDENALSPWREKHLNVMVSDMESFDLDSRYCENSNMFAILTGDSSGNLSLAKKIKKKMPIVIYDKKFWKDVINFSRLSKKGMIDEKEEKLLYFAETVEDAFEYVKSNLEKHYLNIEESLFNIKKKK